jgi:hypothetical protein
MDLALALGPGGLRRNWPQAADHQSVMAGRAQVDREGEGENRLGNSTFTERAATLRGIDQGSVDNPILEPLIVFFHTTEGRPATS